MRIHVLATFTALLAFTVGSALAESFDYGLRARGLAPGVWVIEGHNADFSPSNGCNIINTGFIETSAGTWVINTGPSRRYGEQQRRLIEKTVHRPVVGVLNLNLHPDYFFGNQAWANVPIYALAGSIEGMKREGSAYADNLYKICGDWMRDTESMPASKVIQPGTVRWGDHDIELRRLEGHTSDDLVLIDRTSQVVFTGGIVFARRAPTTPHADIARWLQSLDVLEQEVARVSARHVVPSHGPVDAGLTGFAETRQYLLWVRGTLQKSASSGLDLSEVLQLEIPSQFQAFAAVKAEYPRTVFHLYPAYEKQALAGESLH